jgi:transcriptional regulator with GAF, ATPase, and Fis domain
MNEGERFRLLYELATAFAGQIELEELIPAIIRRCRETLEAESVAVLLHDAVADELYFPYVAGDDEDVAGRLLDARFPATQGIAGAVLAGGKSEHVADAPADPRFYGGVDEATGLTTRSILVAPLCTHRGPVGVIEVVNPVGRPSFTRDDLELLDALAAVMAVAIDNARMFSQLRDREQTLRTTVGALRRDLARYDGFDEIVGASDAIRETLHLMTSAATSDISVLVEGETGTGKELVARGIHKAGERGSAAFVAVNCAALPADLLEAELFGHARGAFTGAVAERRGLFEAAHGGTMFLDEVGDLPLTMQVKLLRVLQEGEIMPVGSTRPRKVDVRIVAATNRNLRTAVDDGSFRADLYYRISAFPIFVPPLRARRDDVALLADRFLAASAERHRKKIRGIDAAAFALLAAYDWPGNVRQLRNEIERAVVLTPDGGTIHADAFSRDVVGHPAHDDAQSSSPSTASRSTPDPTLAEAREDRSNADLRSARTAFESRFIAEQLRNHGGNVSRTAEALGISRVMLQKKMKDYGLR